MKIHITINNRLRLRTRDIPRSIQRKIEKELSTINPEYLRLLKRGRKPENMSKTLSHYWAGPGRLSVPRGFINHLHKILKPHKPEYIVNDNTTMFEKINLQIKKSEPGWEFQDKAVEKISKQEFGVLVFPTGSGKTITALKIVCLRGQPTLIIVHTKTLLYQWVGKIKEYTNITKNQIGLIGDGKKEIGEVITIGIVNSLVRIVDQIKDEFGQLIIDECHRTPAKTFSEVASKINSYYILGLTATPKRSDGQSKIINYYCGDTVYEMKSTEVQDLEKIMVPTLKIIETNFYSDENNYTKLLEEIIQDEDRNNLITQNILGQMDIDFKGSILVISDRINHCHTLLEKLKAQNVPYNNLGDLKIGLLTSKISSKRQKEIIQQVNKGKIKILITTSQLVGEGFDCPNLSSIFLTTPISWQYRLIQYIGRILRISEGKKSAAIYDYVDKAPICQSMFKRRLPGYRKQGIDI